VLALHDGRPPLSPGLVVLLHGLGGSKPGRGARLALRCNRLVLRAAAESARAGAGRAWAEAPTAACNATCSLLALAGSGGRAALFRVGFSWAAGLAQRCSGCLHAQSGWMGWW